MRQRLDQRRYRADPALVAFAVVVFIEAAIPLSRVMIGSMPLYFKDVATGVALILMLRTPRPTYDAQPAFALVVAYGVLTIVSAFREVVELGSAIYPAYMIGRHLLSIAVFFLALRVIRTPRDFYVVAKAMVLGGLVTASVAVAWALPGSGTLVRKYLFVNSFLYPDRAQIEYMMVADPDFGTSAQALVGGENVAGCFVLVTWCVALAVLMRRVGTKRMRTIALIAVALGVLAVLLTYSRSTYLAMLLVGLTIAAFSLLRVPRWVVLATLAGATVFVIAAGGTSRLFRFDFVVTKFERAMDPMEATHSERARVLTYTEILPFLGDNPSWIAAGRGLSGGKIARRGVISVYDQILRLTEGQSHSVFAASFYDRGLLAALALAFLTALLLGTAWRSHRNARSDPEMRWIAEAVLLFSVSIIPFWFFTHFLADAVHGETLLFLVFGLICSTRRLVAERSVADPASADGAPARPGLVTT